MTDTAIRPYRIDIPQSDLDDLRERLARTARASISCTYARPSRTRSR